MSYKQFIATIPAMQEAIRLSFQIQNEGIATVFTHFHGHVNHLEITLYAPEWTHGADYSFRKQVYGEGGEDYNEHNEEVLGQLREILSKGKDAFDCAEIEEKKREERRRQYEALRAEFETPQTQEV